MRRLSWTPSVAPGVVEDPAPDPVAAAAGCGS